jgi:hypothetical protein
MADQAPLPESVTPEQFFEQLLPAGFAAQVEAGEPTARDFTMQYHVTGPGGGDWAVTIADGRLTGRKGSGDANLTFTVSIDDWRDAVLGRNGAALGLIVPQRRPDRPDNSARARQLKGTLGLELAREGLDPFRVELCFNNAPLPKAVLKMKLAEYLDMQAGRLNSQEAFMTGRLRLEGDLAFVMQIAALNA